MKLTFQQDDDLQPKPDARSERRSGFSRARAQLSQAVGGVLVNSLGALSGRRAQSAVPAAAPAGAAHGMRLREVIERDRALVASSPPPAPSLPAAAAAEQDDWMELRAAQDLAEQETSAIRARSEEPQTSTLETFAEDNLEPDEWVAEEARAIEVLAPRGDAIAQAIAEAIAQDVEGEDDEDDETSDVDDEDDDEDTREMVPVQLEPLVASTATVSPAISATPTQVPTVVASSTAATVVMPKPMQVALCKEPIRTRTMAKLLATQGHRERALSIYDHLIQKGLGDESLRAEADALRETVD